MPCIKYESKYCLIRRFLLKKHRLCRTLRKAGQTPTAKPSLHSSHFGKANAEEKASPLAFPFTSSPLFALLKCKERKTVWKSLSAFLNLQPSIVQGRAGHLKGELANLLGAALKGRYRTVLRLLLTHSKHVTQVYSRARIATDPEAFSLQCHCWNRDVHFFFLSVSTSQRLLT